MEELGGNMDRQREMSRRSKIFSLIVLILVAGGLYLNSVANLFTNWDDGMIYNNSQIRSIDWKNVLSIFTPVKGATYQPIRVLSYALDYHFWKLNPVGYHITNILFYILTCIMVFSALQLLSRHLREGAEEGSHFRVALFGSLLFAAHPVHVEAVTWLAARKEVLQGFFFFLAFYLYLRGREEEGRKKVLHLSLVLFTILLATLSKPSAVVFPGVILIYEISRRKEALVGFLRTHWLFFAFTLLVSAAFTFILMKVMFEAGGIKPYRGDSFMSNALVPLYVFLENIRLLTSTVNYSAAYAFSVTLPVFCIKNLSFIFTSVLLVGISLFSLRWTKVIFFSFFFFVITLLPYLNIIPISTLLADRYAFIASFSYVFLLGIVFDRFYLLNFRAFSEGFFKLLAITMFVLLLVGYSFMTMEQNKVWENSYTLWSDAVKKNPESNTANALMGVVFMELGMDQEAVKHLEKAVRLLSYDYESLNNLGIVYGRLGQPGNALKALTAAMGLNPGNDSVKINLSLFYQKEKEYKKAEEILKNLILKNPNHAQLFYRLAMVYKEAGDLEGALRELNRCLVLAPRIMTPYEELGNIYLSRLNDAGKGKFYYEKGIHAAPQAVSRVEQLRWMIQDLER